MFQHSTVNEAFHEGPSVLGQAKAGEPHIANPFVVEVHLARRLVNNIRITISKSTKWRAALLNHTKHTELHMRRYFKRDAAEGALLFRSGFGDI